MTGNKVIIGIILSSGFSSRMGAFKPLLNYNGHPFCIEIIRKLEKVCNKVIVVTGFNSSLLENELVRRNILNGKIFTCYNADYELGMFTSLQTGLRELGNPPVSPLSKRGEVEQGELSKECDWVIVHMIDQPDLPLTFYQEFIQHLDDNIEWVQPEYNGRKGHPVAIKSNLFSRIITAPKNDTLRTVFSHGYIKQKIWKCTYAQVLSDIDTPEDYIKLLQRVE